MCRTPLLDALEPVGREAGLQLELLELAEDAAQHELGVAHHRDARLHVLAYLGRVDVDVDLGGVRRERRELAGDAVVEARAHGDEQVALVHGAVGVRRAVHAQHAQRERVRLGEGAHRHERGGHRDLQPRGQLDTSSAAPDEMTPPPT